MLHNALLLTFVELLLRGVTMLFQRVLVAKIGAAGLGLLQLVLTVGGFAMTLGLAGLRVTAMYLCAEEYGKGSLSGMLPENRDDHLCNCRSHPVFPERLRGGDLDWRSACGGGAAAAGDFFAGQLLVRDFVRLFHSLRPGARAGEGRDR